MMTVLLVVLIAQAPAKLSPTEAIKILKASVPEFVYIEQSLPGPVYAATLPPSPTVASDARRLDGTRWTDPVTIYGDWSPYAGHYYHGCGCSPRVAERAIGDYVGLDRRGATRHPDAVRGRRVAAQAEGAK